MNQQKLPNQSGNRSRSVASAWLYILLGPQVGQSSKSTSRKLLGLHVLFLPPIDPSDPSDPTCAEAAAQGDGTKGLGVKKPLHGQHLSPKAQRDWRARKWCWELSGCLPLGPAPGSFLILILELHGTSAKGLLFQGPGRSRMSFDM